MVFAQHRYEDDTKVFAPVPSAHTDDAHRTDSGRHTRNHDDLTSQAEHRMTDQLVAVGFEESSEYRSQPLTEAPSPYGRRRAAWAVARATVDLLALATAGAITSLVHPAELSAWFYGLVLLVSVTGFATVGAYTPRLGLTFEGEVARAVPTIGVATLAVAAADTLLTGRSGVGDSAVILWLVASACAVSGRLAVFGVQRTLRRRQADGGRTLIVGAGHVGRLAAQRLLSSPQFGLVPAGFLDKEPLHLDDDVRLRDTPDLPVFGASWDLARVVREERIEHVVVAFSTAPHSVMLEMVRHCWRLGVNVMVVPRLYEVEGPRMDVEHLGALPFVSLRTVNPHGWQFNVKYAIDRVIAGTALLTVAPLAVGIALAIRLTMGRPLLFRQRRVGRDGRVFEMLKFRTMLGEPATSGESDAVWAERVVSGEHATEAALPPLSAARTDVDRRTRLGATLRKLSLDELPQLWNVFRGDMSLIGPRPERAHYVERFEEAVYRYPDRHRVKSGLTGWAQVHGLRGETSLSNRIEWDNFYIENWTPWLDLKIIAMTFPALFGRRGAS